MSIEWWHMVLGFIGTNGITYYLAKPKKSSLEIDNLKKIIDEAQEEREHIKQIYSDFAEETNKKIVMLEKRCEETEQKSMEMIRAINTAYRCKLTLDIHDCPVLKTLDQECPKNKCN